MKVITHDIEIAQYDNWAKTRPNSLIRNFINLCCTFKVSSEPDASKIWPSNDAQWIYEKNNELQKGMKQIKAPFDDTKPLEIKWTNWKEDELSDELTKITQCPNGENLLKIIASMYIKNPNLNKLFDGLVSPLRQ